MAIEYKTGKIAWKHEWPSGGGPAHMLTTAGNLLFTSNASNFIAFDPANGKILLHAGLTGPVTAGPITYELDGQQYADAGLGRYAVYVYRLIRPN